VTSWIKLFGGYEMSAELFILALAVGLAALFAWAFRTLPQEQWQIIAAVPTVKTAAGAWQGVNLTYYGFFVASSNVLAVLMLLVLLRALDVSLATICLMVVVVFACCWPAARLIARLVEKKAYTFTVGGAVFVGALVTPWIIYGLNFGLRAVRSETIPLLPSLAATAIAYAYGEGVGRLACISFGCCYGKRLEQLSPVLQRLFARCSFAFSGATKKAAYAGGLEDVRVVPIQALTACFYALTALLGTYLFLQGFFRLALLLTFTATQLWRFVSEWLRDDERGQSQQLSAYQAMALLLIVYNAALMWLWPEPPGSEPDLARGLEALWHPAVLLFGQGLWLLLFRHTGRSSVTGAALTFFVRRERI
jgi:hypothetical protein